MSIYREKSLEEARGIIETFLENHEGRTGVKGDPAKLLDELRALKSEKIKANFEAVFGTLSPISLENCITALKDHLPQNSQPQTSAKDQYGKGKPNIMPNAKR